MIRITLVLWMPAALLAISAYSSAPAGVPVCDPRVLAKP